MDFTICSRWTLLSTYWLALILTDEGARVYCYMVHLAYLINSPLLTWVLLHGLLGLKYLMLLAMHFVIASADLLRDELAVADGDELDLHSPLITVIARKYNQTPVIFSEVYIPLYVQSFLIVLCKDVDSCRMCSLVFFPPAWLPGGLRSNSIL